MIRIRFVDLTRRVTGVIFLITLFSSLPLSQSFQTITDVVRRRVHATDLAARPSIAQSQRATDGRRGRRRVAAIRRRHAGRAAAHLSRMRGIAPSIRRFVAEMMPCGTASYAGEIRLRKTDKCDAVKRGHAILQYIYIYIFFLHMFAYLRRSLVQSQRRRPGRSVYMQLLRGHLVLCCTVSICDCRCYVDERCARFVVALVRGRNGDDRARI